MPTGVLQERNLGTPLGAISPVLANLYMHYAFDQWLEGRSQEIHGHGMQTMESHTAGRYEIAYVRYVIIINPVQ